MAARYPTPVADLLSLSFGTLNFIKHNSTKNTKIAIAQRNIKAQNGSTTRI